MTMLVIFLGDLVNHFLDGFDFTIYKFVHLSLMSRISKAFLTKQKVLHILSLIHAWIKNRWNRKWLKHIAFFRLSLLLSLFVGILKDSLRLWVMYWKWFELKHCCSLAQAAYWFSCGCLCWSFSVVVSYFCMADGLLWPHISCWRWFIRKYAVQPSGSVALVVVLPVDSCLWPWPG